MLNTCTCSHCFLLAQGLCWFNILSSNSLIEFSTCITWFSSFLQAYFFCSIFHFCLTFNVWNVLGLICLSSLSLSFPIASPLQFCVLILSHSYSLSLISPYPPMAFQYNPNADFHKIYISAPNFCLSFWSIDLNCYSSYPLVCLTGISNFMWPKQNSQFSSASLIMSPTFISCPRRNKQLGLFLDFYSSNCYSWSICKLYCLYLQILLDLNMSYPTHCYHPSLSCHLLPQSCSSCFHLWPSTVQFNKGTKIIIFQ